MLQKSTSPGLPAAGTWCSTKIVTCSNLATKQAPRKGSSDVHSTTRRPVGVSRNRRTAAEVAAASPGDRGPAPLAGRHRQRAAGNWLLPAVAAGAMGRPAMRSGAVLRGGPPAGQRVRIDRMGQLYRGCPQLAPRAVRPAGSGRGVGGGHRVADLVVIRPDGRRRGRRRWLSCQRVLGLVVGCRPPHLAFI